MTLREFRAAHAGKTIYPNFKETSKYIPENGPIPAYTIYTIETYLRMKHTDGKWYLCHFKQSAQDSIPFQLHDLYKKIIWEIHMMRLFGIVSPNIEFDDYLNPGKRVKLFELDPCQLSEEARLYLLDDLSFPKGEKPTPFFLAYPYGPEILELWEKNFKPADNGTMGN